MKIKSSVTVAYFLPGRAKDLSAPLYLSLLFDSTKATTDVYFVLKFATL